MMGPFPPPHNVQHSQTPPVGESKCLSDRQEESRSVLECQARWAVDLDSERLAIEREGNKTPQQGPPPHASRLSSHARGTKKKRERRIRTKRLRLCKLTRPWGRHETAPVGNVSGGLSLLGHIVLS